LRAAPLALGVLLLGAVTPAPVAVPELTRCVEANARLEVPLSSTNLSAGDAFAFSVPSAVAATAKTPGIPRGTRGYGVVAYVRHAGAGGLGGLLVLEPRYVVLVGGRHVPVMANPSNPDRLKSGASRDAPDALSYIPVVGLAFSGYNALHRGREVKLGKGTPLRILIGDELAASSCYLLQPEVPIR
jgi:hypothetical protein